MDHVQEHVSERFQPRYLVQIVSPDFTISLDEPFFVPVVDSSELRVSDQLLVHFQEQLLHSCRLARRVYSSATELVLRARAKRPYPDHSNPANLAGQAESGQRTRMAGWFESGPPFRRPII